MTDCPKTSECKTWLMLIQQIVARESEISDLKGQLAEHLQLDAHTVGTSEYVEFTADNMPYHLKTGSTGTQCDRCSRTTWSAEEFNQQCRMPQPNGLVCLGRFGMPLDWPLGSAP